MDLLGTGGMRQSTPSARRPLERSAADWTSIARLNEAIEDNAKQTQYTRPMKSAVIPQVRVEPELRAELEAVLRQGESLSEFVEASVRSAIEFRRVQIHFHERGDAAWKRFKRTGESVPADRVLATLQSKLDARRKKLRA